MIASLGENMSLKGRVRGKIFILFFIMSALAYLDRTGISTMAPSIEESLGISTVQMGYIFSAFSIPYALMQAFGGNIGEKFGTRRSLAVMVLLWAASSLIAGFSFGLISLFLARLLLGFSESGAFPTMTRAMSRWFPKKNFGTIQGTVKAGARLGNALAPVIVVAMMLLGGWRCAFVYTAIFSVLWAVIWYHYFRDNPKNHSKVTKEELAELSPKALVDDTRDTGKSKLKTPWKKLIKGILPLTLIDFGYGWSLWVFITWIPSFLSDSYGLELKQFAVYTSLILCSGMVGDILGGIISDKKYRKTGRIKSRCFGLMLGLSGSIVCMLPVVFTHNLIFASIGLALSFFFLELANAPLWSISMSIAPKYAGTASGIMNTGFGVAGILSPIIFAYLVEIAGWQIPFVASIMLLLVAIILALKAKLEPIDFSDESV